MGWVRAEPSVESKVSIEGVQLDTSKAFDSDTIVVRGNERGSAFWSGRAESCQAKREEYFVGGHPNWARPAVQPPL
jgi:hypothetical protein